MRVPQMFKWPVGQHRRNTLTKVTVKKSVFGHGICKPRHEHSRKFIGSPSLPHSIRLFWQDLLLSEVNITFIPTGFYYSNIRPDGLRRPMLKPVQYAVKFFNLEEHNQNLRDNPRKRKIKTPTFHQRIQYMWYIFLTHSFTKRNKLVSSCSDESAGKISTELVWDKQSCKRGVNEQQY